MDLRFDEDLVEAGVFLCTSRRCAGVPALQIARFHRAREKLYAILEPDERNSAFFRLHMEWFKEWGLEMVLTAPLKEYPQLAAHLKVLAFRKSRDNKDEGAELYVNDAGDRNGVIAIAPERLTREIELSTFLRHELMHLRDMVDPTFGYFPELALSISTQSQQRLARDRYRLLWDVSIDGRLSLAGKPTVATQDGRWTEFSGAFVFWTEAKRREVFSSLWNNPSPTHAELEAWVCDPRELQSAGGPKPGAPCPLCGFPTFAWAAAQLSEKQAATVKLEFPEWTPHQGLCGRCFAVYRAIGLQTPIVV